MESGVKKKKILLVDDDEFFLEVERGFLERENFEILEASNGEEALSIIREGKLDLVLLDLYMPGMDGMEVMVRARAEGMLDLPIVIVSKEDAPQKIQELKDAGANDFITKPLSMEELIRVVNTHTKEAHRSHPRMPATIKLRYRSLEELLPGDSKDISHTGIFVRTRKPLDTGAHLDLYLYPVDENSGPVVHLKGIVVRSLQGDNEEPGMGVKFVNLDEESIKTLEQIIEEQRTKHKVDVLVIDDDTMVREMLNDGLSEAGFKVGTAKDAVEALKKLDIVRPSVILVDIMMPGMDGLEFSATLRKNAHTQDIPFIFVSSKVDKETITKARQSGATYFIAKPFDMKNVIERVRKLIPQS